MRFLLALIACLSLAVPAAAADAATKAALKASFDSRSAQLAAAKSAGTIGESIDGMVAAVSPQADAPIKALVEAENTDRTRLYQFLADETNATATQIGERNAMRNYQNAKPGEWLRTRDGTWKRK